MLCPPNRLRRTLRTVCLELTDLFAEPPPTARACQGTPPQLLFSFFLCSFEVYLWDFGAARKQVVGRAVERGQSEKPRSAPWVQAQGVGHKGTCMCTVRGLLRAVCTAPELGASAYAFAAFRLPRTVVDPTPESLVHDGVDVSTVTLQGAFRGDKHCPVLEARALETRPGWDLDVGQGIGFTSGATRAASRWWRRPPSPSRRW